MKAPSPAFKAKAFRLGLVFCWLSVPLGAVMALVAPMAADSGDIDNPGIIAFVCAAMIYPVVALICSVTALVIRRREGRQTLDMPRGAGNQRGDRPGVPGGRLTVRGLKFSPKWLFKVCFHGLGARK